MFRSGSTLVERILSGHPTVAAGGESVLLSQSLSGFPVAPEAQAQLPPPDLTNVAMRYRQAMAQRFPDAATVIDKRLDNLALVGLIRRAFPDAKIILTQRQVLDNCLSVYFLHLDSAFSYARDLLDIGHYYRQCKTLSDHWRSLYGDAVFTFDYDAFVKAPEQEAKRLMAFCELDWRDECLDTARTGGAVRSASLWQARRPIYGTSSGRWRHYSAELMDLRADVADLLPEGSLP
jgi:hypothetical protein